MFIVPPKSQTSFISWQMELDAVKPDVFCAIQSLIQAGVEQWNNLETPKSPQFRWNPSSTCLQKPKFLDRFVQADEKNSSLTTPTTTSLRSELTSKLTACRVVAIVGDSFSADHISLAGSIERESAAGLLYGVLSLSLGRLGRACRFSWSETHHRQPLL